MKLFAGILTALFCVIGSASWAEPVTILPDMPVRAPEGEAALLEDPAGTIPVEDILSGTHDDAFRRIGDRGTSVGPTKSVWWLRLDVRNPSAVPAEWVIGFPFPLTDFVDIHQVRDGRVVALFALGDERPRSNQRVPADGFAAEMTTPPGARETLYVRFANRYGDAVDPYFEIASPDAFAVKQQHLWTLFGAFFGGAAVMFLYNALVWSSVRQPIYLWYLAYFGAAISAIVAASGLGNRFLWTPDSPLGEAAPPFLSALALALVVQFSRQFLETRRRAPALDRFLIAAMAFFALPPAAFLAGEGALAATLIMIGGIGLSPILVYSAWLWWQGRSEARIFTLGWSLWFLGVGMIMGRVLGLVPSNDFTLRLFWFAILGEAILFAFALADRIRLLQREKAEAERRERDGLARAKAELEDRVAARTAELSEKHDALEALNQQKDRLFSIVAHDLLNPFNALLGMTELLKGRALTLPRGKIAEYAGDVHEAAGGLHKLLENLLAWARLQRGDLTLSPTEIDLAVRARRTLDLFRPVAAQKDVVLAYRGVDSLPCRADPNMVDTVIRNLVGNAVKFSHPGGTVAIDAEPADEGGVRLSVADQGVGMTEETRAALFQLGGGPAGAGTLGETGTGLGLRLCHELVAQQGGTLTVRSAPGKGTTVTLDLPGDSRAAA